MKEYLILLFLVGCISLWAGKKEMEPRSLKRVNTSTSRYNCQKCGKTFKTRKNNLVHQRKFKHRPLAYYRTPPCVLASIENYRPIWHEEDRLHKHTGAVTRSMAKPLNKMQKALLNKDKKINKH